MPGYVIHLAVAEEYLRKHKNNNENYNEFIEGVIFPDGVKDKSLTHYGKGSSKTNLYAFLEDNKMDTSFNRGYFLHLLTDYIFYNRYISIFTNDMYNDYDILNKELLEKYKVILPEKVKNQVFFKDEPYSNLKILSIDMVNKFINEVSSISLDDVEKDIKAFPSKWTKIRPLKKL